VERLGSLQGFYELVYGGAAREKRDERGRIAWERKSEESRVKKRLYLPLSE